MTTEISRICGMDEAGRGSLAGPMMIAAVVLDADFRFEDVAPDIVMKDSKQMSTKQREVAYNLIKKHALLIETEIMTVAEINKMGVGRANIEGFRRLIRKIEADRYIVDGTLHLGNLEEKTLLVQCMVDADETIPATMASGIVAKYERDKIMLQLHNQFPMYGWDTNTGHGTQKHIDAIKLRGVTEHHRLRFVETALRNSDIRRRGKGLLPINS
jgi:ribonuclease HII